MPPEDTRNDIFEAIDVSLRAAYEDLLDEELPDRFVALIDRLRTQARDGGDGPEEARPTP